MIDAFDAASASLAQDLARMTSLGHNLSNAATPGYKRLVGAAGFDASLARARNAGVPGPAATALDLRPGGLRATGGPLDLAIDGEGSYFELRTASGTTAYTRRGDFRLDAHGQLVTHAGHAVMGLGGPLLLRSAQPVVTREGRVLDGGQELGQLKLVSFGDAHALRPMEEGGAVFSASEAAMATAPARPARVLQGHLELSNVDTAAEMVKLIETVRHFESIQKLVQGLDEMHERALRKLGEF